MPTFEDEARKRHNAYLTKIQKQVDAIYTEAVKEAASIGAPLAVREGEIFSFKDYPLTARRVKNLLHSLAKNLNATIVKGIETEWNRAEEKNDALVSSVLGMAETDMPEAVKRVYMTRNAAALAAFTERKQNGLGLSDRVWNYTDRFRSEIEMGLDCCIRDGLSAARTASELKEYLKYPDRLYHRVRDEHGLLQLSKRAKDFHPGRGVYRSSYRNALRLAATEANMAYNTADFQRFQCLDFVVGIEIHLSNNHTIKDRRGKTIRLRDICDELAGRYPKDFHFTGWHPLCRCQVRTILKTKTELKESMRRILRGEKPTAQSVNSVTAVPENFEKWLRSNKERYAAAVEHGTAPYFLRQNPQAVKTALGENAPVMSSQEILPVPETPIENQPDTQTTLLTKYETREQVNDTFKKINDELKTDKWFLHGDLRLETETNPKNNGSTDMKGKIKLTQERELDVKSALSKIGNGKSQDITDKEADAMATFWHEITHNRNILGNMSMTIVQRKEMELANEFVARHTLPEFYEKLGCKDIPHPELMKYRRSTGYNTMVTNYDYVIDRLGLSPAKVLDTVRKHLFTGKYTEQAEGLRQGLLDGGLAYLRGVNTNAETVAVTKQDLEELLTLIRTEKTITGSDKTKETKIEEWLIEHNFIQKQIDGD